MTIKRPKAPRVFVQITGFKGRVRKAKAFTIYDAELDQVYEIVQAAIKAKERHAKA